MAKVLAAKHTASLQLLCTVGGNQARLDVRTEFKILEPSLKGGVEAGRAPSCISTGNVVDREASHIQVIFNQFSKVAELGGLTKFRGSELRGEEVRIALKSSSELRI